MSENKINNLYKFTLFLLPLIYIYLFGRYGFEDSDSGFIVSMGWRILNGELPYKDFYYVRPPLSPYLSALFLSVLPEHGQLFYIRLITYIMLLISVLMTTDILNKFYDFKKLKLNKYLFSIISFMVLSIGHIEFQWHTTDGIFFAILGLWLLTLDKSNIFIVFVAGTVFTLSALTKQNFIIIPIISIIFTLLMYGKRIATVLLIGIVSILLIFYYWLDTNSLTELYRLQTTGVTSIKDLVQVGLINYFINDKFLLALTSIISILLFFIYKFRNKFYTSKSITLLVFGIIILINLSHMLLTQSASKFIRFDLTFPIIITLIFIYLITIQKEKLKNHYILIYLFTVAWTSSISWGYATPILYFIPIIFAVLYVLSKYYDILNSHKYNLFFILLVIIYSIPYNLFPYRDKPIWKLDSDAVEISNKAAFIVTNKDIILKHKELSILLKNYPNSTVLPSVPHAYYLNNLKNQFKIDWAMDVEAAYDNIGLVNNINSCCKYAIVEKKLFGQPIGKSGKFYSSITDYVIENFKLIDDKNNFFNVYKIEK